MRQVDRNRKLYTVMSSERGANTVHQPLLKNLLSMFAHYSYGMALSPSVLYSSNCVLDFAGITFFNNHGHIWDSNVCEPLLQEFKINYK